MFVATLDGFQVEVTDRALETGEGLLYTIDLREVRSGLPVDGASVFVTATADSTRVGPLSAIHFGDQYQVLIPDPGVPRWDVRTTIQSDRGATAFEHQIVGTAPRRSADRVALILVIGGGAVLLVGWMRRRRRVSDPPLPATQPGA